jgi:chromosomal replication initiator protein
VIAAAARQHGLEPEDLIGPSRRRGVTGARAIAMFVLRAVSGRSLHAIGQSFGGRDHTTVMHAVRLVGERIASDPATARDVERLLASVAPPRGGRRCRLDVG